MSIQAGNRVNLLRIEGANAVVGPANSPFEGKVPIMSTDILQQLAANPPANAAHPAAPKVNAGSITDASSAPPDYSPAGESEEPVAVTPPPPVPEPAPAPAPIPDPVPAPVEDAVPEGPVDVVAVMKESVQSAQIKEFKADQVQEWTAGEQETVEGTVFQTGKVLYKATTFLGEKTIEAKAFIKGGKVQRWIWPRSGMEIR